MNAINIQKSWERMINFYSKENTGRSTRLGVFERERNSITDYWIEDGLELVGIDIDTKDKNPTIGISVGEMTHEVSNVVNLVFRFGISGDEDGIDLVGGDGRTTILRFEDKSQNV
ncbi:hypothetical protein BH10ACI2_BH10ACI2_25240 [soil metagenome]